MDTANTFSVPGCKHVYFSQALAGIDTFLTQKQSDSAEEDSGKH